MKKVAVIGKPANGKSTLSKQLAAATGLPLYALDSALYEANGEEVKRENYEAFHARTLASDAWIIEGFGPLNSLDSFKQRLAAADTVIYIDLPYSVTYWLVTKRFLKGMLITPDGWPEGSSIVKGTLESFKVLKRCPAFWNEAFVQRLEALCADKSLHVIRSVSELNRFVENTVR